MKIPRVYGSLLVQSHTSKMDLDRISALPDEIIIHILSLLTLKEAASSSLVSKRWKDLWRFIPSLNLDPPNQLGSDVAKRVAMPIHTNFQTFIGWVNNVLNSHKSSKVDRFRVCFFLVQPFAPHIDRWVSFAVSKKVEYLELNLSQDQDSGVAYFAMYTFPFHLFAEESVSSLKYLILRMCRLLLPPKFGNFKSLLVLSLTIVDIADDMLDKLLSNCTLLERLCVQNCENLVNLKATHSQLKYLELYLCLGLKSVDIYATSLQSFKYLGLDINLSLKCVPQLVDVYFGAKYSTDVNSPSNFDRLSYFFSHLASGTSDQLETLVLDTMPIEVDMCLKVLPTFLNLKMLTLLVHAKEESFVGYSYLLQASPLLRLLKLHILARKSLAELSNGESEGHKNEARQGVNFFESVIPYNHRCLKEIEMTGFLGYPNDMCLAKYLLKNATALNKFTIDPYCKRLVASKWLREEMEGTAEARECARQLIEEAPKSVQLLIL